MNFTSVFILNPYEWVQYYFCIWLVGDSLLIQLLCRLFQHHFFHLTLLWKMEEINDTVHLISVYQETTITWNTNKEFT